MMLHELQGCTSLNQSYPIRAQVFSSHSLRLPLPLLNIFVGWCFISPCTPDYLSYAIIALFRDNFCQHYMGLPVLSAPLERTESISSQEGETTAADPRESDWESRASYAMCWNILTQHSKLRPLKLLLSIWLLPCVCFLSAWLSWFMTKETMIGMMMIAWPITHWWYQILV